MSSSTPLGDYLKARRRLVTPEDVGLPRGTRRRVPGLRREELALLAGISQDYYLRLEQGRDTNPSRQVLDALASVLALDTEATAYLYELATAPAAPAHRPGPAEQVPPGLAQLLDEMPFPAFVQGRHMDVLAANALARALSPQYRPGVNLLRAVFLDPRDRDLHQDWDRATAEAVAGLRAVAGADLEDPRLTELVDELSAASAEFRALWARQDVHHKVGGISRMRHPTVGELVLRHEKLTVNGAPGQMLVIYHADPGSSSHAALEQLARASAASPTAGLGDAVLGS
ncbi:helix-turn-helix domain-containing protein [Myceligenerans indicum]|uniref:Helix-turn-helix transcriptional regulator n=1 Tax=Myceligenerans indicum TaxID=2593663 RepID=A0ABS1LJZ1_9MICO|nr:helix-turn-helix transcriptional regulator [Myceligenerans indicum]MBL0886158.1 helix-turn-helix transcriptional regulator [Myceligenerans indicum]